MNTHKSLKSDGLDPAFVIEVKAKEGRAGAGDYRSLVPPSAQTRVNAEDAAFPSALVFEGVPRLNLTRRQLELVFGSPRLVQRMKYHRWIVPLNPTSSDQLFPVSRVLDIQFRMESGEMPPPLPSEKNVLEEDSQ